MALQAEEKDAPRNRRISFLILKANVLKVIHLANDNCGNSIVCLVNLFTEVKSMSLIKCVKLKKEFP